MQYRYFVNLLLTLALCVAYLTLQAQDVHRNAINALTGKQDHYVALARRIWKLAEPGYLETQTSGLLKNELRQQGFHIDTATAGIPTAFVASFGNGHPVIDILAEMDALPDLSQDTVAVRKPLVSNTYGHGCGHNLFGVGSVAAAIQVSDWLRKSGKPGTAQSPGRAFQRKRGCLAFPPIVGRRLVACDGMSIGLKAMMVAAKTITLTAIDLFGEPDIMKQARTELNKAWGGEGFEYKSLVGDRQLPLDYRRQ